MVGLLAWLVGDAPLIADAMKAGGGHDPRTLRAKPAYAVRDGCFAVDQSASILGSTRELMNPLSVVVQSSIQSATRSSQTQYEIDIALFLPPTVDHTMARRAPKSFLSQHPRLPWREWIVILVLALLVNSAAAAEPNEIDAENWRCQQLALVAEKIQKSGSDEERLEYVARQSWLCRWIPGQMPLAPNGAPVESELVEEPLLTELVKPSAIDPNDWQQMIALQARLLEVDTDDEHKENLRTTIELARPLEQILSDQFPLESQQLATPTAWVLAYTRYRLGRALAYRELPEVRERWPISHPNEYEEQLSAAYQRLAKQASRDRVEFVLLTDRMLRRAGKIGRALELLEASRSSIEPKWYLKKRRDLLQELGWDPAYQEAAQLYLEAGYSDES